MTLAELITTEFHGSQRAFAKSAGIDEGQLSKYLAAERGEPKGQRPSADNIARIERASGGQITASYWFQLKRRAVAEASRRPARMRPRHA